MTSDARVRVNTCVRDEARWRISGKTISLDYGDRRGAEKVRTAGVQITSRTKRRVTQAVQLNREQFGERETSQLEERWNFVEAFVTERLLGLRLEPRSSSVLHLVCKPYNLTTHATPVAASLLEMVNCK